MIDDEELAELRSELEQLREFKRVVLENFDSLTHKKPRDLKALAFRSHKGEEFLLCSICGEMFYENQPHINCGAYGKEAMQLAQFFATQYDRHK